MLPRCHSLPPVTLVPRWQYSNECYSQSGGIFPKDPWRLLRPRVGQPFTALDRRWRTEAGVFGRRTMLNTAKSVRRATPAPLDAASFLNIQRPPTALDND